MMRFRFLPFLFVLAWPMLAGPARAASLDDASALMRKGDPKAALVQIEEILKDTPNEAPARFLKGIVLAELHRTQEAIQVFSALTRDRPELPEPYNNLAVLYAADGNFDEARKQLDLAIRTHPSYAVAHENLGDIYAKMASMAYGKALQLDQANTSAQTKLELIRDLFSPTPRAPVALAESDSAAPVQMKCHKDRKGRKICKPVEPARVEKPAKPATQPAVKESAPAVTKPAEPAPATAQPVATPVMAAPSAETKPAPVKVTEQDVTAKADKTPTTKAATGASPVKPEARIETLLAEWAKAWSRKDADAYLSYYNPEAFQVPDGKGFAAWAEERRARITAPRFIRVQLYRIQVTVDGDRALVRFKQQYESDRLKNSWASKVIEMRRSGDDWKIVDERS